MAESATRWASALGIDGRRLFEVGAAKAVSRSSRTRAVEPAPRFAEAERVRVNFEMDASAPTMSSFIFTTELGGAGPKRLLGSDSSLKRSDAPR